MTAERSSYTRSQPIIKSTSHRRSHARYINTVYVAMSREDKVTRLRERRACFRCGRGNHVARECRKSRYVTFDMCQGRHNRVLCDLWRNHIDTAMASRPQSRNLEFNGLPTNQRTLTTSVPTSEPRGSSVLLQTTKAWASKQKIGGIHVRLLLNIGSQRKFIASELSNS